MKNLKVSMKLIVSFILVIALTIIVGVVGFIGMSRLNAAQSELYDKKLLAIEAMGNLRELFANERNAMRTIMLHQDDSDMVRNLVAGFADFDRIAADNFALYETTIMDASEETAYFEAKGVWLGDYATLKRDSIALINQERFDEAYAHFASVGASIIAPITNGFAESASQNNQWAAEADAAGDTLYMTLSLLLVGIVLLSIVAALVLAFYVSGLISKPLMPLMAFMTKASTTGDLSLTQADQDVIANFAACKDEVGQVIGACAGFVGRVTEISNMLETVAGGDLSVDINMLSEKDTMGGSMSRMVSNLNDMFGEINNATAQVSTGSKQIADGAQALAQGSTEQAASVEQLSASIGEIARKTKENADMAARAAMLASTIKGNAEKGSKQMNEMTTAVKEINQASQSISKVIKVIDDIAFQTNILALNAAVEAARAGQHGKGFAVVAEEVRNLAAKSAEAAKDTGGLIANSMEKAELGSRIAGETADSLAEIVSGINESSQIVGEIAMSSNEQTVGISQINTGIDQVAQVIQQNSATAEESAAASEEMSSQSNMLEEMVAQFKLKDDGSRRIGLEAPRRAKMKYDKPSLSQAVPAGSFGKY